MVPLAAVVPSALAQEAGVDLAKAKELVQAVSEEGIREVVAAKLPQAQKIERFRTLFNTYFDMTAVARFVLGTYVRKADEAQQARFSELFREVNIYTWARRFKDYNGQKLAIAGVTADGAKGAYVDTRVEQTNNQQPMSVRWRLRARDGVRFGLLVVDLEVEGVSMALTYRSEYGSLLQGNGGDLAALNAQLEQQVQRLRAEQPAG